MSQNTNSKSCIIVGRMTLDQVKTSFGRTRFFTHTRKDGSKYTVLRQVDKEGNVLLNDDGSYCNVANVAADFDPTKPAVLLLCVYKKERYNYTTGEVETVWSPTRWLCNEGQDYAELIDDSITIDDNTTVDLKKRFDLFERELSYIADTEIKKFAKQLLAEADDYFFAVPASSTGNYHPAFALGNGGLVRHTKAVAYFVNELIRPEMEFGTVTRREADLLIVAAIAHDIKKQGDGLKGHTVREHPALAADYVNKIYHNYEWKTIDITDLNFLCEVIRSHMGPWQDPKPTSRKQLILFYADYIASRKEIVGIDFIENGDNRAVEPYEKPVMTVDAYKFNFGKAKGMTIAEAYEVYPDYIIWIAGKEDFGNQEIRKLVIEFLNNR